MPCRWSTRFVPANVRLSRSSTRRWPRWPRRSSTRCSHLDPEAALAVAKDADVELPFGGVPMAVKLGTGVAGWPASEASIPLADLEHGHDSTMVSRLRSGGSVLFGQSTMSEFAGLNQTRTKLHGATRNPWNLERTPGGSSGGASALVAGGVCTIATGGDGGGSIRIPAAFCGLPGLEGDVRAHPQGARGPSGQHDIGSRLSVALGSRHRPLLRRDQRPRPSRPVQLAEARELGGRARPARPPRSAGRRESRPRSRHRASRRVRAGSRPTPSS